MAVFCRLRRVPRMAFRCPKNATDAHDFANFLHLTAFLRIQEIDRLAGFQPVNHGVNHRRDVLPHDAT